MQEIVTLHAPGAIPGIGGESVGPGTFLVDWDARTIEEVPPGTIIPVVVTGTTATTEVVQGATPPEVGAEQEAPST